MPKFKKDAPKVVPSNAVALAKFGASLLTQTTKGRAYVSKNGKKERERKACRNKRAWD